MIVTELAEMVGYQVVVKSRNDLAVKAQFPECRWYATLGRAFLKKDNIYTNCCGYGTTPDNAVENLIEAIRGKVIVFNINTKNSKEYKIPQTLVSIDSKWADGQDIDTSGMDTRAKDDN